MSDQKPLFIPLKRAFYDAFKSGDKDTEFRPWGPRWNATTCAVGRPVVLPMGYGKKHRMTGRIVGFSRRNNPEAIPGWTDCYKAGAHQFAACIFILVDTP